ncbi:uncharacterized protein FIBRA_08878 [Fibroporia radiculosa]|uniref:Uncharacterized protein n=1 Tax=Fibroporia radiculosa TaxID=599839 RepID=J4H5E5_9APHY|nr:uncharacterized protein FIBRA_08878 [Fibroporia radiculosa]CCM06599.1 predicted protein [Fibroporia radiculosa]
MARRGNKARRHARSNRHETAILEYQRRMVEPYGRAEAEHMTCTVTEGGMGVHLRWFDDKLPAVMAAARLLDVGESQPASRRGRPLTHHPTEVIGEGADAAQRSPEHTSLQRSAQVLRLAEQRGVEQELDLANDRIFKEQWTKLQAQRRYEQAEWKRAEAAGVFDPDKDASDAQSLGLCSIFAQQAVPSRLPSSLLAQWKSRRVVRSECEAVRGDETGCWQGSPAAGTPGRKIQRVWIIC